MIRMLDLTQPVGLGLVNNRGFAPKSNSAISKLAPQAQRTHAKTISESGKAS